MCHHLLASRGPDAFFKLEGHRGVRQPDLSYGRLKTCPTCSPENVLVEWLALDGKELEGKRAIGLINNGQKAAAAGGVGAIDAFVGRGDRLNVLVTGGAATEFVRGAA